MKIFLSVKLALLPFALFWALLATGHPDWAIWSGFTLSLAGGSWRMWHREWMVREVGEFLLFTSLAAAELTSPVWTAASWTSYGAIYGISKGGRLNGSKSPIRNLVIAGSGNAGAGVEAALISGAEAAEALRPGLLSKTRTAPATAHVVGCELSVA